MLTGNCINAAGLVFDIVGVVMVWRYGLPPSIDRSGAEHIVSGATDQAEVTKGKRYDRMARIGVGLLVLGFALQLLSDFWPRGA